MTNKEILQADLLDILFEKRNKDYGAYAIRRGYHNRLLSALGAVMSLILLFVLISSFKKRNIAAVPIYRSERIVELSEIILPKEKPKEPEKPKEATRPVQKTASIKYVSKIVIMPDVKVKNQVPEVANTGNKLIADTTQAGVAYVGIPKEIDKPAGTGNEVVPSLIQPGFTASELEPEFPGGRDALKRFLASNLTTPSDLEEGEKKTVQIRFKVDKDGSVNTFEIMTSGGHEFDNEVVRVCRKMPRWIPALQNGIHVPVSYMLPVTFIGAEQ